MATAEYWLYPSYFQETSCITSLELLASEVICLYYPIAGLVNTVGDYGIKISEGNEIDALLSLSIKTKNELKRKGKEYALSCSWQNRAIEWSELLFLHNDSLNITNDKNQLSQTEKRMFYLYESFSMPEAHIKMLKTISDSFTPKVIYDIGSNTLHWTKEAKNIWTNSEIFAFDAIQEAEELYKSKNVKYNIGVLSDLDNKIVKFYENKENPAGNSYYKEIGHPNSVNIFPEDSYSEKIAMTLETVVKRNNFLLPDLVKIDVQGAELDILKGGQNIINNAKYLIIELQNVEYNRGAPLENVTIDYLQSKGWEIVESKFSNNGPDADYLFINTNYTTGKILNNVFTIKIVNLERRSDRKTDMINKLSEKMVNNYEFFEAVDGNLLEPSQNIKNLFKNNNFNYRKGVIGCALSHYELWKNLINDDKYSYYVILEDDIELVDNFNEYIEQSISIIQKQDIKYALIGGYQIKDQLTCADIISFDKITQPISSGTFGYIISKEGCKVLVNYLNKHGINTAIDYSLLYTNCLDMYKINKYLVTARAYQIHGENDTDIQLDYNCLNFDSIPTFTVSFVDWWSEEYCGGTFDNHNNYFTNLLSDFYDIKVVSPEENPDILFYSVFGNNHLNLNAKRKIFYTGEPIPQDPNADFNITFDNDNDNNCRLPLWLSYLNDTIINDYNNKIQNKIEAPQKSKFCSIICQQDNVSNTRSEIVNKLSKYKRVDCGGKFLNNIGYVVPRGINCSGKIEHNTNYKFAITFENKEYPGYVTEKICDAYKSKCIPIYWGTKDVVKDFNPSTFINANNFANFDELIDYIIKVDNDDKLYKTFFKEPIFSNKWLETFNDINKLFFKNLADRIIGKNENLLNEYFNEINNNNSNFYSQNKQDEFISKYIFKGYKNGYFMDIGANDGITINNTLHFEEHYNWRGTNVEPLDKAYKKLVQNRPKCNNIQIVINNIDGLCDFIHNDGYTEMISGLVETYCSDHKQRLMNELNQHGGNSVIKKTKTKTLKTICNENNISHINYLSIDVEGAEMVVLESIDYHHTFIDVISFEENYENTTQSIIKFLETKGYIYIGKFGDIIMINEKSKFIKNLNYHDISSFSCYGSKHNIKLKNILHPINYNKKNDNFRNYIFQYGIDSNKKDVTDIIVNILESTMQNFVIPIGDNMRAQLFGDPCWGHVKNIYIYNKNYPEETIIVTENESKIIYFDEKYNYNFVMGFYDNGLSERGTTTMMFSYADYTEKYFKCKSIIFYNKHHHSNNNEVINRFSNRFDVYRVENFEEIDRIILDKNIKYLYNTCGGLQNSTPLVKNCKNLIHAVFQIEPFGDKYSAISDYIVKKSKFLDIEAIPYMIDLPIHNDNMRNELNLPDNAFVIGRIGGYEQFDIKEAHKGIINFLNNANNNSTYFVFVNTQQFYEHPQIIYLDKIVEPYLKVKYINTCNCMIHARSDGETFGLAVGEFSSLNKPIITCRSYKDNCHLDILGEKAIIFDSETSLINILKDIKSIVTSRDDWNAYKEYTPDKVMKKFHKVFLPNEDFINICNNIKFYNITFDNINYEIIDIGNNQTSAIIKK
jgi:FkbM family methyltransferase